MASARTIGIGEAIGLILGLIGMGIQMRWPDQKWLGWVFISAGVAVGIGVIIWVLAIRHARKQFQITPTVERLPMSQQLTQTASPHNEFNPHNAFNPKNEFSPEIKIYQNQKPTEKVTSRRDFAEPHIEFTNPEVRDCAIDAWGRLIIAKDSPNPAVTMLARFYYKPERNVPPYMLVKAHISIADAAGVPLKARYDGAWLGHDDSETVQIRTADTLTLVVAILSAPEYAENQSIVTWGFGGSDGDGGFVSDQALLIGGEFLLTVEIVGKYSNDVVLCERFNFKLRVSDYSMALT